MITIIHGDDITSSRDYLLELKKLSENPITISNENLSLSGIMQTLKGDGLFNEEKDIFVEEFLSSRKNISDSEKIIELIKKTSKNIYFWEKNEQTKTNLSIFSDAKIKLFKIPQNIFYFLDNIKPKSPENVINFHETLNSADADAIFYMILRQFRLLIAMSGTGDTIDEVKRLALWQKDKLKRQAGFFTIEKLKKIYDQLFNIDLKIKVGEITNLTRAIDIFLLEI
ncbi:MAG TPA: hypothetical protein VKC89_02715 [Patescibacteria group bacterium]|nr:hypothetical protein [Patescibacteria group bacterium]